MKNLLWFTKSCTNSWWTINRYWRYLLVFICLAMHIFKINFLFILILLFWEFLCHYWRFKCLVFYFILCFILDPRKAYMLFLLFLWHFMRNFIYCYFFFLLLRLHCLHFFFNFNFILSIIHLKLLIFFLMNISIKWNILSLIIRLILKVSINKNIYISLIY